MPEFNQDDVNVRIVVTMSCSFTAGLYGPVISRATVVGLVENHLRATLDAGAVDFLVDNYAIADVHLDDGTTLIASEV